MRQDNEGKIVHLESLPDSIIVKLEPEFRKAWFARLFRTNSKELAQKLKISRSYLYHLKNGRHHFRLSTLKAIAALDGMSLMEIESRVEELISNRGGRAVVKFPIAGNADIARLLGHCFGDGSISTKKREFDYVNLDAQLILELKKAVKRAFGSLPTSEYPNKDGSFKVAFSTLVSDLLILFGAPRGKKVESILSVPDWIKKGDVTVKAAFLEALFDDDGSVLLSKNYAAKNVNLHFTRIATNDAAFVDYLNDIRTLLFELGIEFRNPYLARHYSVKGIRRNVRGIFVSDIRNIMKFRNKLHFRQTVKRNRLDALVGRWMNASG